MAVRPNGLDDERQFRFDIDREKASAFKLSLEDVNTTLSSAWGSEYVNDFVDRGRIKRVFIQGDADFRMLPQDFNNWYTRNADQQMVPFAAFATGSWTTGSPKLERYNGVSSHRNSRPTDCRHQHRHGHGQDGGVCEKSSRRTFL